MLDIQEPSTNSVGSKSGNIAVEVIRAAEQITSERYIAWPNLCGCGEICNAIIDGEDI